MDAMDRDYQNLMDRMDAEKQSQEFLAAVQVLLNAEKLEGLDQRKAVAAAIEGILMFSPAAKAALTSAHGDLLQNDHQLVGGVRVVMASLFNLVPAEPDTSFRRMQRC